MAVNLSFIGGAGWQFFTNSGVPLSGGKIYTYAAGTTTPQTTYTSRTGLTANANPIILDSAGRTPQQIWSTEGLLYKYVVADSNDVVIRTWDNIGGSVVASDLATDLAASSGSTLVGFIQSGTGAVAQTVQDKLRQVINVLDYGAVGDGVTDDTDAVQDALNAATGEVRFPAGTYVINSTITVPKNVSIVGDGTNVTFFDASNMPDGNITNDAHIYTAKATYTALPSLSTNVVKNDQTLTFSSAPNVDIGDVLVIYNPTDYSWSGFRAYYRAGEYVRVAEVSGSTVTIEGSACASYNAAAVTVYRVDNMSSSHFKGFTILGKPNSAEAVAGLKLNSLLDTSVEDVRSSNSTYIGIALSFCYNVQVRECTATDDFVDQFGGEYGLLIGNSQSINVVGGNYSSHRHGTTIGGGDELGVVPNRYISITGATITTAGGVQAADVHGNAEYVTYADCMIDGGFGGLGGDFVTVDNCQIRGKMSNGPCAILFSEMKGANFRVTNNTIQNDQVAANRGALIDLGGNTAVLSGDTRNGGDIVIENNTMIWDVASTVGYSPVLIYNRGYTGTEPVNVYFNNNKIYSSSGTLGTATQVRKVTSSDAFGVVQINGNSVKYAGGFTVFSSVAEVVAESVTISNNTIHGASTGIGATSCQRIVIENNSLYAISTRVLEGSGFSGSNAQYVQIVNNLVFDGPYVSLSSSAEDVSLRSVYAEYVYTNGNFAGTNGKTMLVASGTNFQVGDTITGGTSGTTATILAKSGNNLGLGTTSSGAFTPGETVTGSPSGASSTVTSVSDTVSYFRYFGAITNLYRGADVNRGVGADGLSSVTNDIGTYIAPSYTTVARNALTTPKAGQIILNTTTGKLNFYTGSAWEAVTSV